MSGRLGARAVVVGAGVGGMIAAGVLSEYFGRVTVVEKDALPVEPMLRKGTPQASHVHGVLKGGVDAFEAVFPGFGDRLQASGGVPLDMGNDTITFEGGRRLSNRPSGMTIYAQTRALFEHVVRGLLRERRNVEFRERAPVTGFGRNPDGAVTGVDLRADGKADTTLPADLVVEAAGRSGVSAHWLMARGLGPIESSEMEIGLVYTSALVRRPPEWRGRPNGWIIRATPPDKVRSGTILPVEDEQWIVSLSGRFDDFAPADPDGFLEYTRHLEDPVLHEVLQGAEPTSPIAVYRIPRVSWRHYDRVVGFPDRLIPLGDSITAFNPLIAQGMSAASLHAMKLRECLGRRAREGRGLRGISRDYLAAAMEVSGDAWSAGELTDFAYPEVTGVRPPDLAARWRVRQGLMRLAGADDEIRLLLLKVRNMMERPAALERPDLVARALAAMEEA